MSAFTRHPSTHVFFHVQDKSAAQQASPSGGAARRSGGSALGLGSQYSKPQGLSLNISSRLPADHASLLGHGSHGHFGSMMGAAGTGSSHHSHHMSSHLARQQHQAGAAQQSHRPVSTILSGGCPSPRDGGSSQWDDFDLFCQSSYPRLSPLGERASPFGGHSGHPLDTQQQQQQLIGETTLGGPAPLNLQSTCPGSAIYGTGSSGLVSGSRVAGRGVGSTGLEDECGASKAPATTTTTAAAAALGGVPPRLRSSSYYSIPLVDVPTSHSPTAPIAGEHSGGSDHRTLADAYEYHRGTLLGGCSSSGVPEWEGNGRLLSGSRATRFDSLTKGGLRPSTVDPSTSGKWGHEWDARGQLPQTQQGHHMLSSGTRRPPNTATTREPLAPANRTNAYHLKDGQYEGYWTDIKGQQGAENLDSLGVEGLSPLLMNPVDVLTVSARMLHRILPGLAQPSKAGQHSNLCGLAVSSVHVTDRDTCVVMDMCESAGFCARDLPSPATELLPLPRDWISIQLARHKHTFGWFKHNYNTMSGGHIRDAHKSHTLHHPLSQSSGQNLIQSQQTSNGLLLMNVERNSQFPFMTILSCRENEVARIIREIDELHLPPGLGGQIGGSVGGLGGSLAGSIGNLANSCGGQLPFGGTGYCANCSNVATDFQSMSAQQARIHHTGAYIEVANLARRKSGVQLMGAGAFRGSLVNPLESLGSRDRRIPGRHDFDGSRLSGAPQSACALDEDEDVASTGYIVSFFRVFPGEDSERLDRSWPLWTGARQIHGRLPKYVGLNRISFHKKIDPHSSGITYVLLCECPRIMDYLTEACVLVDQLRARCCGYTALYRVIDSF